MPLRLDRALPPICAMSRPSVRLFPEWPWIMHVTSGFLTGPLGREKTP